ncbi:alpha/beta fold hydrolase [Sinomonas mesophila]|uniref:alpha/beta fold hydrolase n=1 Tax=Sinomonas mesophila TaxID=1531955 RepID=UPI000984F530|nr:alpha/beta hydrolase [Sinomonas mesophila]
MSNSNLQDAARFGMARPRHLSRPEGRVAYELHGEGPLVVCVPGMGDLRLAYRFLAADLARAGFSVAVMDLRGHGDSDAGFTEYGDVPTGGDMLALLRELGRPAVLVGSSMGAGAAVWAAAEAPELVRGLVLIGPFVRNPPIGRLTTALFRLAFVRPWGPLVLKRYVATLYPGRKPEGFAEHLAAVVRSARRRHYWRAFTATTRTSHAEAEARLGQVRSPALVVMGERDPDFPDPRAEAEHVAARLGGRAVMVPRAGHYPHAEYAELVSPEIVGFLREVDADA